MNPLGYSNIQKSNVGRYMVSTMALNGRGFRTIIVSPHKNYDAYLACLIEDNKTFYEAMNCHRAFIMTITNRKQMKGLL